MRPIPGPNECDFCEMPAARFYCGGAKRCDSCAEAFNAANRTYRKERENQKHVCDECGEIYRGVYDCPHCCSHEFDPDEGYHCLSCGTDGTEDVMSRAYDEAKDRMKYGS